MMTCDLRTVKHSLQTLYPFVDPFDPYGSTHGLYGPLRCGCIGQYTRTGDVDEDIVDYVLGDVGTDVLVVGAFVVLGGEDDDVVAVVGTVVVNDVDGGVVSPVEVGGVVDVTVDHIVELFKFPIVQPSVNILQPFLCFFLH